MPLDSIAESVKFLHINIHALKIKRTLLAIFLTHVSAALQLYKLQFIPNPPTF